MGKAKKSLDDQNAQGWPRFQTESPPHILACPGRRRGFENAEVRSLRFGGVFPATGPLFTAIKKSTRIPKLLEEHAGCPLYP